MDNWRERCDWCGWPLENPYGKGCKLDDCSMRPLPKLNELGKFKQELRKAEDLLFHFLDRYPSNGPLIKDVEEFLMRDGGPIPFPSPDNNK